MAITFAPTIALAPKPLPPEPKAGTHAMYAWEAKKLLHSFAPDKTNFYESMSALSKSIRLRERENALLWLAHLTLWYPAEWPKIAARVLLSAGEDCISPTTQMWVAIKYNVMIGVADGNPAEFLRHGIEAVSAITKSPNWYQSRVFSTALALWVHVAEGDMFEMSAPFYAITDSRVLVRKLIAIHDPATRYCALASHYVHGKKGAAEYAKFLIPVAGAEARAALTVLTNHPVLGDDESFLNCAMVRMALPNDVKDSLLEMSPTDLKVEEDKLLGLVKEKQIVVPAYYLDGIVTPTGVDKRFASESSRMLGCCFAWHETGGLNSATNIKASWCIPDALAHKFNFKLPSGA